MSKESSEAGSTVTGFLRPEFERLSKQADTMSIGFLAGTKRLEKVTKKSYLKGKKNVLTGSSKMTRSYDPGYHDVDTSISEEQAQSLYEAATRRELDIRRRMAAPGRDGMFMRGMF